MTLLSGLWLGYSASRLLANDDLPTARHRAAHILDLERFLHIDLELWLNHTTASTMPLAVPMAFWYASLHYIVTPAVLVFLFLHHRDDYARARNAIMVSSTIGLAAYIILPTAPPRLMPGGHYLDALAETARYGWWTNHASAPAGFGHLTNERAAMPSLHVGWSVWVCWALWRHVGPLGRSLASAYVLGTTFVVIATGNHWVLDALVGAVVIGVGVVLSGRCEGIRIRRSRRQQTGLKPLRALPETVRQPSHAVADSHNRLVQPLPCDLAVNSNSAPTARGNANTPKAPTLGQHHT